MRHLLLIGTIEVQDQGKAKDKRRKGNHRIGKESKGKGMKGEGMKTFRKERKVRGEGKESRGEVAPSASHRNP